jgi:hypothetical protein
MDAAERTRRRELPHLEGRCPACQRETDSIRKLFCNDACRMRYNRSGARSNENCPECDRTATHWSPYARSWCCLDHANAGYFAHEERALLREVRAEACLDEAITAEAVYRAQCARGCSECATPIGLRRADARTCSKACRDRRYRRSCRSAADLERRTLARGLDYATAAEVSAELAAFGIRPEILKTAEGYALVYPGDMPAEHLEHFRQTTTMEAVLCRLNRPPPDPAACVAPLSTVSAVTPVSVAPRAVPVLTSTPPDIAQVASTPPPDARRCLAS